VFEADEVEVERIVSRAGERFAAAEYRRDAQRVAVCGRTSNRDRRAGPLVPIRGRTGGAFDDVGLES